MPRLTAGRLVREIDVVVLDKDGTLVDFDLAWRGRLARAVRAVAAAAGPDGGCLVAPLHRALGSTGEDGAFLADGPYLSATLADKAVIVASVLYRHGRDWERARRIADSCFLAILTADPEAAEIRGIGDVRKRLGLFKASGARLAVATNDERAPTVAALDHLGIADLVELLVCGDDAGIAAKPAPDGLLRISGTFGVAPRRLAMIGDAASDMAAAEAAGAGARIGVLSGPSASDRLSRQADIVVADIHAVTMTP